MRFSRLAWMLAATLVVTGCSSRPAIPVNEKQALVMESSMLAAGITAKKPDFSLPEGRPTASSTIYNERDSAVAVHYRYYWYDEKGLEVQPLEVPKTIIVPAKGQVTVTAISSFYGARKVRLYLYL